MYQIIMYLKDMSIFMILALPFLIIYRIIRINSLKKRGIITNPYHEIGIILFVLFLIGLASQTIIPNILFEDGKILIAWPDFNDHINRLNLIPFKVLSQTYHAITNYNINYFIINFLGNIIMFIPIGFFIPLLWNKTSYKRIILIGFLISLTIEICQLGLDRGTDIDDLLLNTLGTIMGLLLYKLINKIIPKIIDKFKVTKK